MHLSASVDAYMLQHSSSDTAVSRSSQSTGDIGIRDSEEQSIWKRPAEIVMGVDVLEVTKIWHKSVVKHADASSVFRIPFSESEDAKIWAPRT